MRKRIVSSVLLILASGCSFSELDLSDRNCPCQAGYTCIVPENRCIRGIELDSGADVPADTPIDGQVDSPIDTRDSDTPDSVLADRTTGDADVFDVFSPDALDAGPRASICDAGIAGELVCIDFEGAVGRIIDDGTGAGTIADDLAYRGSKSLHATPAGGGRAYLNLPNYGPVTDGDLFAQVRIYFPSGPSLEGISVLGLSGDMGTTRVSLSDLTGIQVRGSGVEGEVVDSAFSPPLDRWFCLRLHLAVSLTDGSLSVMVDDEVRGTSTGRTTLAGGYSTGSLGIVFGVSAQGPADAYFDEFIVSNTPITCDD